MIEKHAFNSDIIVQKEIQKIINSFLIKTVVETGTYVGNSAAFFSKCSCFVHTIELKEEFYNSAINNLRGYGRVKCHLGNSVDVLSSLLPSLNKELTLFYLDAHWEEDLPLKNEIKIIAKHFKDNCVIIIDDCFVPDRKLQYDIYKNTKIDINLVKEELNEALTDYIYYYNDRSQHKGCLYMEDCYGVGKLYAFPKALLKDKENDFFTKINGENYSIL